MTLDTTALGTAAAALMDDLAEAYEAYETDEQATIGVVRVMTKRDRKELARYVRWCADAMGLRDWCVDIRFDESPEDPEDPEAGADILCTRGRKHARIRLCEDFRDLEPEQQRHYIVHELLHPHFDPIDTLVEDDLQHIIGRPAWDLFSTSHNRAIEFAVDGIAYVLAEHMPLIEWPKPKKKG